MQNWVAFSLTESTLKMNLSLIRHRVAEDTSSRLCYVTRGLLQLSPRLVAEDDHWWAAAGIECRSTSDLWHRQVRSRSVTVAPRWTALAWHYSMGAVQACRVCLPMSPESSTNIPCRSLHSHLWSRWSPAPTIRQSPTTECIPRPPCYRQSPSAGPTVWNSLPDNLRCLTVGPDQFQRELKSDLFACLLNISSTVR